VVGIGRAAGRGGEAGGGGTAEGDSARFAAERCAGSVDPGRGVGGGSGRCLLQKPAFMGLLHVSVGPGDRVRSALAWRGGHLCAPSRWPTLLLRSGASRLEVRRDERAKISKGSQLPLLASRHVRDPAVPGSPLVGSACFYPDFEDE
jgi:hypothetical protein